MDTNRGRRYTFDRYGQVSPTLYLRVPCLHPTLLDTSLISGSSDYWWGLLPQIGMPRYSHIRPLNEYGAAMIAIRMNRASEFKFFETTCSFLPYLMKLDSLVCIQIGAPSPSSPPGDWEVSGIGRQFIRLDGVLQSIRSLPPMADAMAEELVYRARSFL